ncbi:MAG TPA: substrate-binding domain-containing protein, partial [Rhizobacter sp.]|nr:substrate-binding domain-containing protein [Rhizobacter sp.]
MSLNKRTLLTRAAAAALVGALPLSVLAQKKIVLGFSQVGAESEWRTANTESIKSSAKEAGIELKFSDAQQKQENQIKAIRSFIAQGVDAILLAPVVETGWDAVLKEAKEAKIPVVLLDRDIDPSGKDLYLTAVTSDSVHEGEVAGDWLAKTVGDKACNIVELQGTVGASVA